MRVEDFYVQSSCAKLYQFSKEQDKSDRAKILSDITKEICRLLHLKQSVKDIQSMFLKQIASYETQFAYDWQVKEQKNRDYFAFTRFLKWFYMQNFRILDKQVICEQKIEGNLYVAEVNLVVEKGEKDYYAIFLTFEETKRSNIGKSSATITAYDLRLLVAKAALEKKYPGIKLYDLHIMAGADKLKLQENFQVLDTKEGNGQLIVYEKLGKDLDKVLQDMMKTALQQPKKQKCFDCKFKEACKNPIVRMDILQKYISKEDMVYEMPEFTKRQSQVIFHKDGPLLVCAGPGSGKTATLISRVKRLIEEGVDPSFLLVITFTNKAAGELRERCLTFLKEYELPYIATFNSLGYDILRKNKHFLNQDVELLDGVRKLTLLENLTLGIEKLDGFLYGLTREENYAPHGFLKVLSKRVEEYNSVKANSVLLDCFYAKHPELNRLQFDKFMELFQLSLKSQGYITHNEQISLAVTLLKEHAEVLKDYQNMFKYIMVDEYQDVNAEQAELVYLLGSHGNIVAVGDDDQSIYEFRGGSAKYMQDFQKRFQCKTIVLNENFRSKKSIVEGAISLIASEEGRFQKDLCATRRGDEPIRIIGNGQNALVKAINQCIEDGYSYSDIAVLDCKNEPLEKLKTSLMEKGIPSQLGKCRLIYDGFFRLLYLLLNGGDNEEKSLEQIFPDPRKIMPLYEKAKEYVHVCTSAEEFITCVSTLFRINETVSATAVLKLVSEKRLDSLEALKERFSNMIRCQDEERIVYGRNNEVVLLTSHDSKGKEFSVVIIEDGDFYENAAKEEKNLLYVAMTRAKDRLYIQSERDYLSEYLPMARKED